MNEIKEIVNGWIKYTLKKNPPDDDPDFEYFYKVTNWELYEPEKVLLLIKQIMLMDHGENKQRIYTMLAAGPLESLLARHGSQYIDEIESWARKDKDFNYLLGGVWQNMMPDDIWQRVVKVRKEVL